MRPRRFSGGFESTSFDVVSEERREEESSRE